MVLIGLSTSGGVWIPREQDNMVVYGADPFVPKKATFPVVRSGTGDVDDPPRKAAKRLAPKVPEGHLKANIETGGRRDGGSG